MQQSEETVGLVPGRCPVCHGRLFQVEGSAGVRIECESEDWFTDTWGPKDWKEKKT